MEILIDAGHGCDTPGKCSPDGRLREWRYCRDVAAEVAARLKQRGYEARLLVTEDRDIPLAERVRRANAAPSGSLLVSIHCNAAGMGSEWKPARGWSAFVATGASAASRRLASSLARRARACGLPVRLKRPGCLFWDSDFYILRHTRCPAVLTENLFQDNRADVGFLLSPLGREAIVKLHVEGITGFLEGES